MRYSLVRKMDISNGPGIRVSIFMQGCHFNCKNCFNKETHDFSKGEEFNDDIIKKILTLCEQKHITGLSILGGEPLHPTNIEGSTKLAKMMREKFPKKNIWIWTGYLFNKDLKNKEILNYIDVLVDGVYIDELHDFRLKWRGSSNQRVIDIKKSKKNNDVVLYTDEI